MQAGSGWVVLIHLLLRLASRPGLSLPKPRGPFARTANVDTILEQIRRASSVLDIFPLADELAIRAASLGGFAGPAKPDRAALVEAVRDTTDAPTAIAAAHALARVPGPAPDAWLAELLVTGGWLAPHVAWSLAERSPAEPLVAPLTGLVEVGRLGGLLAQRTLLRWARQAPEAIARVLIDHLRAQASPAARGRLIETLGLIRGADPRILAAIAGDRDEPIEARTAAIAALGDRPAAGTRILAMIATGDDAATDAARLALLDHRLPVGPATGVTDDAIRISQVHLGGWLDRTLAHAGEGDTGGIATLLVQLGDALAADPRVASVTTIGRGPAAEAIASLESAPVGRADRGHAVVAAGLASHQDASFTGSWPAVVAAERSLRRVFGYRRPTVLHLRMADVGSLAASRIARRQGIPYVFTLAPDPHAVIAEMERSGDLDRRTFGPADARAALWFRARLVRHLADSARQVALFPRKELAARLRNLLGIDVAVDPRRYHVVPEGIDMQPVRAARSELARLGAAGSSSARLAVPPGASPVVADLAARIGALGPGRRGLALVVSVGRLAEVKGMARIVEAFAADADLRSRANLVIVGGNLDNPTPEERAELEQIEAVIVGCPELAEALVLMGHRPHDDVLRVLAIAEAGLDPWIAPGGAYVCGSRKEEFGLAIVEALGIGLPVVAPRVGGPASYVEDGVTGMLVDTLERASLSAGIHAACDLAGVAGRAARARRLVEERFTIGAMADSLARIYETALAVPAVGEAGGPVPAPVVAWAPAFTRPASTRPAVPA